MEQHEIKKYLSEKHELIKSHCYIGGTVLLKAPTGAGKTYTLLKIGEEICRESKGEFVFLFVTPTRIQSEQNGINYNAFSVVSGVNSFNPMRPNTIVYDKLNVVLRNKNLLKDKKIILIVDEAHELIYSSAYRKKALDLIQELSSISYTVVHVTATSKALPFVYSYEFVLDFKKNKEVDSNVFLCLTETPLEGLTSKLINNLKEGVKTIVSINDKDIISYLSEKIKSIFPKIRVSLFTSDNKESPEFQYLIKNNKMQENIDLALCTNILNAGINIKNENVELVYYSENRKWNLDHLKQFAGRTRQDNAKITVIARRISEKYRNDNIKTLQDIYDNDLNTLKVIIKKVENLYRYCIDNGMEFNIENFESFFKSIKFDDCRHDLNRCLDFNESAGVQINQIKLIKAVIESYDSQFLRLKSLDGIIKELSETLDSNVKIVESFNVEEQSEKLATALKEFDKNKKKETKELKNTITETFINSTEQEKEDFIDVLKMCILKDELYLIETFKLKLNEPFKFLINKIIKHHNLLSKFKKIYNSHSVINPFCLHQYISNNFNERFLIALKYKAYNNIFKDLNILSKQDTRIIGQKYLIIRKSLEGSIQKFVNLKQLTHLFNALQPSHKQVTAFKDINPADLEKFYFDIQSIFKVSRVENRLKISSLIK